MSTGSVRSSSRRRTHLPWRGFCSNLGRGHAGADVALTSRHLLNQEDAMRWARTVLVVLCIHLAGCACAAAPAPPLTPLPAQTVVPPLLPTATPALPTVVPGSHGMPPPLTDRR